MGKLSFRLTDEKHPARLYLATEYGTKICKVGIAERPVFRVIEMQTGNPRQLKLRATWTFFCSADAYLAEQLTLTACRKSALRGEWVKADPQALERLMNRIHHNIISGRRITVRHRFRAGRQLELHNQSASHGA